MSGPNASGYLIIGFTAWMSWANWSIKPIVGLLLLAGFGYVLDRVTSE